MCDLAQATFVSALGERFRPMGWGYGAPLVREEVKLALDMRFISSATEG